MGSISRLMTTTATGFLRRRPFTNGSLLKTQGAFPSSRCFSAAPGRVLEVTAANFTADVMQNPKAVVLQCTASWCDPCKRLTPILKAACAALPDDVEYAVLDVDAEPDLAAQLKVKSLPTVFGVVGGKSPEGCSFTGGQTAEFVATWLAQLTAHLPPKPKEEDGATTPAQEATKLRLVAFAAFDEGRVDDAAEDFKRCFLGLRELAAAEVAAHAAEAEKTPAAAGTPRKRFSEVDFDETNPLSVEFAWCLTGLAMCALCPPAEPLAAAELLKQLRDSKRTAVLDSSEELRSSIASVVLGIDAAEGGDDDVLGPARAAYAAGESDTALDLALKSLKRAKDDDAKAKAKKLILTFVDAHGSTSSFSKTARQRLANALFA